MAKDLRRELARLRAGIDAADDALVRLLARRRALVLRLVRVKRPLGIPVRDGGRESALLRRVVRLGAKGGLEKGFVARLFKLVMADSKKAQRREAQR